MFDIGFPELLIVSVVALLVLGPERLPEALRTMGLWFGRMRRSFSAVKIEIEREIGMDEVRRQLHNEAILEEMRALETDVNNIQHEAEQELRDDRDHSDAGLFEDDDDTQIFNEPHPSDSRFADANAAQPDNDAAPAEAADSKTNH